MLRSKKEKTYRYKDTIQIIVLVLVFSLLIVSVIRIAGKYKQARALDKHEQRRLENLEKKQAELEQSVQFLETDRGKEQELRERFRAVHEGEELVIIVDEEQTEN